MAILCLLKDKIDDFKKALKNKEIDLAKLLNMTTEERTAILRKYTADDAMAKKINTLSEEKLVLKNRLQGIKNWASKVGEIGRYDPAKKAKLDALMAEYKFRQQERIFSPKENEAFLSDLAEETLGTRISKAEAQNIFTFTKKVEDFKKGYDETTETWKTPQDAANYGASKVVMENYIKDLKGGSMSVKDSLLSRFQDFKNTFKENKPKAVVNLLGDIVKTIANNSVSLVATLDNSFMGRQGLHTLMTHPTIWWDGAKNSFIDIAKTMGGKNMNDALMADIYSKPNYLNGDYNTAKIIPKFEEQYPTSLPEKIPVVGRVFKASESAFVGSALRMRTGLYDLLDSIAKKMA